jgi:hypothetical protein
MTLRKISATALLASAGCAVLVARAPAMTCGEVAGLALPNTKITSATLVPAGPFSDVSVGDPYAAAEGTTATAPTCSSNITSPQLPAFCRVTGGIAEPSAAEPINFEVWLPLANWNGKFEALGNHGFSGEIEYSDMGPAGAAARGVYVVREIGVPIAEAMGPISADFPGFEPRSGTRSALLLAPSDRYTERPAAPIISIVIMV